MNLTDELKSLLTNLNQQSTSGFAITFHVVFTTSRYSFQTYDEEWMDYYSKMGVVMKDPAVRWGLANNGIASLPELQKADDHGILGKASEFGLKYWAVMATSDSGSKSIGSFSRSDRDFTAGEREQIFGDFQSLHSLTLHGPEDEPKFGEMLLGLSIRNTRTRA